MITEKNKDYKTHGNGNFSLKDLKNTGTNVVIEGGVLIFHPENISIGNNVYIGHCTILKGYYKNEMSIGDNTWIGQNCFFHSAGGIEIGRAVGIGPCVKIITSAHSDSDIKKPVLYQDLSFKKVFIEDGVDIGVGSIILPGVIIGEGTIVGAGAVVTGDVGNYSITCGKRQCESSRAYFKRSNFLLKSETSLICFFSFL